MCVSPDIVEAKGYTHMIDETSDEIMKASRLGKSWVLIIAELHHKGANETAVDWCKRTVGQPQACRIPQLVVPLYLVWFGPRELTERLQEVADKLCEDIRGKMVKKRSRSVRSTGGSSNPREHKTRNQVAGDNDTVYKEIANVRQQGHREDTEPPETDMSLDDTAVSRGRLSEGWQENVDETSKRPYYSGTNKQGEVLSTWFRVHGDIHLPADATAQDQAHVAYALKTTNQLVEKGNTHRSNEEWKNALACYEEAHGQAKDQSLRSKLQAFIDELRPRVEKERRQLSKNLMDRRQR